MDYHLKQMPERCYDIPRPPVEVNGLNNAISIVDDSVFDTVSPINPLTGHRDDMISRLFAGDTSDSERQLIMSQLATVKGVSSPRGLSDEDILSLVPSRYMSDPVEMERYREFVDELRQISDTEPIVSPDEPPVAPPPAPPAGGSE
ncbi:MAG: hypothetical protein ACTTKM_09735 [Prevotella fusca]